MKRRYRLAEAERFRQVRSSGKSYAHPLMVLVLLPNELEISRCGFTTSRRIGKAVVRNRVRRQMRAAVWETWDLVEPGWDMVWVARPAITRASFSELQSACIRLLTRAHILTTKSQPQAGSDAEAEPAVKADAENTPPAPLEVSPEEVDPKGGEAA